LQRSLLNAPIFVPANKLKKEGNKSYPCSFSPTNDFAFSAKAEPFVPAALKQYAATEDDHLHQELIIGHLAH